ncbi:hypothetical protein FO519_003720 [Halicephalobus sp. NKZ332]|nr:hypothetical protein FO519_003720 [Halicephalobus sp. NKZ332]
MEDKGSEKSKKDNVVFAIPKLPNSSRKNEVVPAGSGILNTKKEVRKALPEEQYVENMKTIIQRDYFPDIKKLRVQNEYLEAMVNEDEAKILELQAKYGIKKSITDTPGFEDFGTPSTSYSSNSSSLGPTFPFTNAEGDNDEVYIPKKKKKKALDKFNLQSYVDTFTSEDNASFDELVELMNERERKKNAWMYEAEKKHNEELVSQLKAIKNADEQLLAIQNGEVPKPIALDNWTYKARNSLLFNPGDDVPLTKAEYVERLKKEIVINKKATRVEKDETIHAKASTMTRAALLQAASQVGKIDVTGKDLGVVDPETLGYVSTPLPEPGVEDTPLMTWGEIDGTPFRLDGDDDPVSLADAPVFKMPEIPMREKIRDSMNEIIGKRSSDRKKFALETAAKAHAKTPGLGSKTENLILGLSPAARLLMKNKLKIKVEPRSEFGTPSTRDLGTPSFRSTASRGSARSGSTSIRDMIRTPVMKKTETNEYPPTPDYASTKTVAKKAVAGLLTLKPKIDEDKRPKAIDFD